MHELVVAWRIFWRRFTVTRTLSIASILAVAFGTAVVLLALKAGAQAAGADECLARGGAQQTQCRVQLGLTFFTVFGLPGLVLIAVVTLTAAGARRRELVELRFIGVSRRSCARIVIYQAVAVAVVGVLIGVLVYYLLLTAARALRKVQHGSDAALAPGLGDIFIAGFLVIVISAIASWFAVVNVADDLVGARKKPQTGTPGSWRGWLLFLGILTLSGSAILSRTSPGSSWVGLGLAAGALFCCLGLAFASPLLADRLGRVCTGEKASPGLRIAGRSLRTNSYASGRVLSILLVSLFISTFALGLWEGVARQGDRAAALKAETKGPNIAHAALLEPSLTDTSFPVELVDLAVPFTLAISDEGIGNPLSYPNVLIGTCDHVRVVVADENLNCSDKAITSFDSRLEPDEILGEILRIQGRLDQVKVRKVFATQVDNAVPLMVGDLASAYGAVQFHIPWAALEGKPSLPQEWVVWLPPGNNHVTELANFLRESGGYVNSLTGGPSVYAETVRYRSIVYTVMLTVIATTALGSLLSLLDHALARRELAGKLAILGMPRRIIRRSMFLEVLIPMIAGALLSIFAGTLAAYLSAQGDTWAFAMSLEVGGKVFMIAVLVAFTVATAASWVAAGKTNRRERATPEPRAV